MMRAPLRASRFFAVATTLFAAHTARAENGPTCGDAFDQSQVQRDDGKLLEARQLLRICSGPRCSPTQQRLCSEWLTDVEARIPSVVVAAKDGAGHGLVDVKVSMDGAPIATRLDGRAIEVEPGPHVFAFEGPDGSRSETRAIANERAKGVVVAATLGPSPTPAVPAQSANPWKGNAEPAAESAPVASVSHERTSGNGMRTVAIVAGAAGVAGLVVGSIFGAEALSTKSAHCQNDQCDSGAASDAYEQATFSTVSFVAGGVLLASGVTLWMLAPKADSAGPVVSLVVAPSLGHSNGLQLTGRW